MTELPAKIPGIGRTSIPLACALQIRGANPSFLQVTPKQVHRLRMAQLRSAAIKTQRLRLIFGHPAPGRQQVGVVVHRPIQSGFSADAIMLRCN
ncbi:hypothetical protein D3C84_1042530 [compost metagenome]